jgi:divalent metal cation (Fe/Co/Zn/Cd) transporter
MKWRQWLAPFGVIDVGDVRMRWIGHSLRDEFEVVVDDRLSVVQAHHIAVETEHRLAHQIARLTAALVRRTRSVATATIMRCSAITALPRIRRTGDYPDGRDGGS